MFGFSGFLGGFLLPNLWVDANEKDIEISKT